MRPFFLFRKWPSFLDRNNFKIDSETEPEELAGGGGRGLKIA